MVNKELSNFYGVVLRSPWMSEAVKLSFKVTRRDVLLICQLVERGLSSEDGKSIVPADAIDGLRTCCKEMLAKAEVPEEFIPSSRDLTGGKNPA
ncbi:MAG: hypothetical protein P4L51_23815 [Puia sp.]|nr:hypothetical protein [Puia sp.]